MRSQRRHTYSKESVQHALAHHESTGALTNVEPPAGERKTWRVVVPKFGALDPFELSDAQAWGLCIGLAAGEDHARVEHERFVHELQAYNGDESPACVDVEPSVDELLDQLDVLRIKLRERMLP